MLTPRKNIFSVGRIILGENIFPLDLWVSIRAQSFQRARNMSLSTKEQQNPSSSGEVTAVYSRRGWKKNNYIDWIDGLVAAIAQAVLI